ncbi:MAG: hypothetical protein NZ952_05945 [Candidatus Bathyarchaeota archaeon]|nr:hypothetical protein [Candidatus Bathyarchaeota archaeon]
MRRCYLINGSNEKNIVRLLFYNPELDGLIEFENENYKPYFFTVPDVSGVISESLKDLSANLSVGEKIDLFSGKPRKLLRVELSDPSQLQVVSRLLRSGWESEVPYVSSYVYDNGLVFGAMHTIDGKPTITTDVDEDIKLRFREKFSSLRDADPLKYEMLEFWFSLCSQPIPQTSPNKLGLRQDIGYESLYLAFMLSRLANIPLPSALSSRQVSVWIKSILHSYLRRKNTLIPADNELRKGETPRSIPGGLTLPPKPGTYFNTYVLDFESLYPSIIDSYNLSYETIDCNHGECAGNRVPGAKHHVCTRRRGVYSILIGALRDLRVQWFKPISRDPKIPEEQRRLAEAASRLLKLILVASYGVTVRIRGLACPALAESITAYGRYALKESWSIAEEMGLEPLYGDTDSLFINNPDEVRVQQLIGVVRERLRLGLALDKIYSVCILTRAMKAYFGVRKDGQPDIKGLTAIKANSPNFIKNVFNKCVSHLVNVENWADLEAAKQGMRQTVTDAIADLRAGRIPISDLKYNVRLHLEPLERAERETMHQPYQSAIQFMMLGKGLRHGDIVSFVKVKPFTFAGKVFTVKPSHLVTDLREVDIESYVRNLKSALSQVFRPMGLSFEDEQKRTLADFI